MGIDKDIYPINDFMKEAPANLEEVNMRDEASGDTEYHQSVQALREALDYVANGGELIPAQRVFERIEKIHGFSPE